MCLNMLVATLFSYTVRELFWFYLIKQVLAGGETLGIYSPHEEFIQNKATRQTRRRLYLDADDDATVFDELREADAIICVLVEGLVEEDDPADEVVHALVSCEKQLAVAAAVLLRVLNPNGIQTFGHAACRSTRRHGREQHHFR